MFSFFLTGIWVCGSCCKILKKTLCLIEVRKRKVKSELKFAKILFFFLFGSQRMRS